MISSRNPTLLTRGTLVLCASLAATLLGGCGTRTQGADSFLGFITPYRIDIVQGNAVTKEQVARVRPGMSRDQVQALLGTPMLASPFHADRWDYFFSLRRPGTALQQRVVVAHFKGDVLDRLVAPNDLPSEAEFVASVVPVRKVTPPALELSEAQRKALPPPAARKDDAASQAPVGAVRSYPPLEPR
ncbi:MAG: outer membrane protein assembly factor BamE [Rubrivivax sp.]|nr:outer membrane protein assembly factor BamE [Rubrivivax sp.]